MIGTNLKPVFMGKLDVAFIFIVNTVATLSGFKIDVSHLGIIANSLPEHLALIVTQVNTMHMRARVFTLHH